MAWYDEKGLTLVEVVVAFAILTVAVLGMLNVFTSGFIMTERAGDATKALNLAQEKMEELKAAGTLSTGTVEEQLPGGYRRQVIISQEAYSSGLYRVQVLVIYPTAEKDSGRVALTTLLWKR
ncbi:MAG: prepilin-type N-terminal cleavage/methylation domain-containing protein [Thermoanaerobacteraceae bacterium]|nr:prepilin-type N-terminal cleavage/methylation domain-containing protein [Thermoanaerobacteraceae bacterium]